MKKLTALLIILLSFPIVANATSKIPYVWNKIDNGFSHTKYTFPIGDKEHSTIHAFKIDPKKYRLSIVKAKNEEKGATVEEFAKKSGAFLVINGGFFTPEHKSIGLLVKDGRILNEIHKTSWWSIFMLKNDKPSIIRPDGFRMSRNIQMAIQAGPRLVINGRIPKLKENIAMRSAIGVTDNGEIVIVITSGHGISMHELARRMKNSSFEGGLNCKNAMALDGGSSSQIYVKMKNFEYSQRGLAKVTNGVTVLPKNNF